MAYDPASIFFPFIITLVENVTIEFLLAPVLHILSKVTKSPKIVLPFTPGLEYSKVTSVRPTFCSTLVDGLGCGACTCADTVIDRARQRTIIV